MKYPKKQTDGFTLLELAIVIAIIGIVVGGITAGSSMIGSAERRNIYINIERYITSVGAFQAKYEALPGDMYNAIDIWDAQDAGDGLGTDCTNVSSSSVLTCNGNGDSKIGSVAGFEYEMFRMWQQLANTGFIEGKFTGVRYNASNSYAYPASNVPRGPLDQTGYTMIYVGTGSGSYYAADDYGHVIHFGKTTTNNITHSAALTAEHAWHIDTKLDDGMPGTGNIRSYDNTALSNCATSDTAATAEYDLDNSNIGCNQIFITGF